MHLWRGDKSVQTSITLDGDREMAMKEIWAFPGDIVPSTPVL